MTDEDKHLFDNLNTKTYLMRLVAYQNGLSIVIQKLTNSYSYHLCYNAAVLASISITDDDINISVYKYFKLLAKKVYDIKLSEYITDDGHFLFDEFEKYCNLLKTEYDNLDKNTKIDNIQEESLIDKLKRENNELRLEIIELRQKIMNLFLKI